MSQQMSPMPPMSQGPQRPHVSTPQVEEERADLLATLAAARELGPEMDASLVDSYMRRRAAERDRAGRAGPAGWPGWQSLASDTRLLWILGVALLGLVLLAGAIASFIWPAAAGTNSGAHGPYPFWLPWLFFPYLLFLIFGRRGSYRSRRRYSYDTEDGRRVYVSERSRGYWPDDPDGRGPSRDPRDPYAPPPPPAQRPPADSTRYGADYRADYRTDYRADERRDPRAE